VIYNKDTNRKVVFNRVEGGWICTANGLIYDKIPAFPENCLNQRLENENPEKLLLLN